MCVSTLDPERLEFSTEEFCAQRDIGVRTPQRGGHSRVSLTQVSAGSSTRYSDVQTPRPRGA
ncbi:RGD1560622 (predicted), partial [Rattus norvegicus]